MCMNRTLFTGSFANTGTGRDALVELLGLKVAVPALPSSWSRAIERTFLVSSLIAYCICDPVCEPWHTVFEVL